MFKLVYRVHDGEAATPPEGFDGVEQPGGIGPDYRVIPADRIDNQAAFVEPTQRTRTCREVWNLLEKLGRPDLKIAWSAAWGRAVGEPPAIVVPMLNLRLGLVRVSDDSADTLDYARRLAGIGFHGVMVVDPPAGPDRSARATAIATTVRNLIDPPKPAPKTAPKPAAKPPAKATP